MRALLIVVVAILVNLPVAREGWTDRQVRLHGEDVEAVVVDLRDLDGRYLVDYTLPKQVDPGQTVYSAAIDRPSYEAADRSDRLAVRVVPDQPGANRPEGLVQSSLFTVIAVVGDIVLAMVVALLVYRRRNPGVLPSAP